ncbi:hypothetical protein OVA07_02520 [Novosphingobium sp. SL115]|uniref:hypothetical protein n=1 Tax=Novosphingobium sp. SL115 TaxID=2995150 RepID=UPI002275275E|nr:hypothetical protein [Novosphingobium sp. SL115]MCY1669881.1 hypothetical protein [Novosphingobium sp. SL115]
MREQGGPAWIALAGALALAACGSEPAPAPSATPAAPPSELPDAPPSAEPEPSSAPVISTSKTASAVSATYAPQDECADKPGWPTFRKALGSAIKGRDVEGMAALASADVTLDYGGGSGIAELKKRLTDPASGLWKELDAILPLGCAVEGGLAAMPWVFWNVPDDIDSYSAMLVLGDDTPLLAKPGGKAVGAAGWQIVGIDPLDFAPKAPATRVTLRDGGKGYVETERLRSLLDYRLIAEPKGGTWQITAFIAGD